MSAINRRIAILETLCKRRFEKMNNLAFEFQVCKRTIEYDVNALSSLYPIYTTQGKSGGVYVVEGFYFGNHYLTWEQKNLLESLIPTLNIRDASIIQEILIKFSKNK